MLMRVRILFFIPLFAMASAWADELHASAGHALDAMAPKDRFAARVELRINRYDQWFDNDGRREKFNAKYDGVELNGAVFPALALMTPFPVTLGTTSLNSRAELEAVQIVLGYGLSDDITLGMILPFAQTHTLVDFSVIGGNTGFNPAFDPAQPISGANFPFAPVGGGTTEPVSTAGVKKLLTDPVFGYAYAPVENSVTSGLSDPTVGLLWRAFKDPKASVVVGAGVRLGLAANDNPDSLVDIPVGDSSTDIRLRLEYFRDLGYDFDLHLLAENFTQLADRVNKRVLQPGQLLAPANSKERLRRNLGDYQEYDIELGHRWDDWRVAGTWHLYTKAADRYRSDKGTDTRELEKDTRVRADQWRASISWSGINAWRQEKIAVPLIVKFEMQDTYGGRNFPKVRDFYLQVTSFF